MRSGLLALPQKTTSALLRPFPWSCSDPRTATCSPRLKNFRFQVMLDCYSACMGRGSNVNNSVDILQIGSHYAMNAKSGFRKRATGGAKPKHPRDARQTPRMAPRDHVTRCLALAIIGFGL